MTRVFITSLILAGASLAAACTTTGTTHQMAKVEAATALQNADTESYATLYAAARDSAAWGDRWTSANLFERALAKTDGPKDKLSVQDRFNVATRYEQTGRLPEAAALYRSVARDGRFLWGVTDPDYQHRTTPLTTINLGDESARRLAQIEVRMAYAQGPGAQSAAAAGVPAAAIVGAPLSGRVSDAEARRLDDAAQAGGR